MSRNGQGPAADVGESSRALGTAPAAAALLAAEPPPVVAASVAGGRLATAPGAASVDEGRIASAVREILLAIGEDPLRDGLRETPARVARAYAEMFAGLNSDPSVVLATMFDERHDELVLVKDIELHSVCEHHLLPFRGVAHVGYLPGVHGRITGLSKLARVVDGFARRPQVQERLTSQVADALVARLDPRGVIVVVECEHTCMTTRGVQKPGSTTVTSAVRGTFEHDRDARREALDCVFGRATAVALRAEAL